MIRPTSPLRPVALGLALALAGAALGGCISVFPKTPPSQLYRFAAAATAAAPASADTDARVALILTPVTLSRASAGDQILTSTGDQAAFIAGARWVSPAAVLWEESVRAAFAGRSAKTRLLTRTEVGTGQAFLRVSVPVFEARYPAPDAAPTVQVRVSAILLHRTGPFSAARSFEAAVPAADNRVGAIVSAFDQATEKVTAELLAWTDANAEAAARDPAPPAASDGAAAGGRAAGATRRDILSETGRTTSVTSTTTRRPPPRR